MATKAPMTPEEALARAKLKAVAQGVKVWRLEGTETPQYAVPSTSMDGTAYLISTYENGDVVCTCPGFTYRMVCKHAAMILVRRDIEFEAELASARAAEDREAQTAAEVTAKLERDIADLYQGATS